MTSNLKIRLILAATALSATVPAARAYDFQIGGVCYNIAGNNKSVSVTYGDLTNPSYSGDVFIPNEVTYRMTTYPVKAVESLAFFYCQDLTSVRIPDAVTQIGDQAFSHCVNLESIQLPAKMQRLGDYSFENCESLTELTIPASVTQIGFAAFTYCRNLESFTVEEGNPVFTSVDGVLLTKTLKNLIHYPAAKTDEEYAIPATVTTVADGAFSPQTHLQRISVGPSLTSVVAGLFAECYSLQSIDVDSENPGLCSIDGVLYDKDVKTLIQYPIFRDDDLTVPPTVETLGEMSLLGARYLGHLSLPASLKEIGTYALTGCTGLSEVVCEATVPPFTETNPLNTTGMIFDSQVYGQATLQVPAESLEAYRSDKEWGKFKTIYEIGGTAIDLIEADASAKPGRVFDLLGRKAAATAPGRIYIINGKKIRM